MVFKFIANRPIIFFFIVLSIFFFYESSVKAETCHRNADNKIVLDDTSASPVSHNSGSNYNKDWCNEEPLFYKVKFYEVKLCTGDPYVAGSGDTGADPDFTTCVNIFENSSGKDIVIEPGKKTGLFDENVFLPMGGYFYSVIILSNEIGIKHYETYIDNLGNDAAIKGYGASSLSSGTVCWSIDKTTTYTTKSNATVHGKTIVSTTAGTSTSLGIECGSTLGSSYDYTTEIIDSIDDTCDSSNDCDSTFRPYTAYSAEAKVNGSYAAVLVKDDNLTVGTNRNNSTRIVYIINFNNPLLITEDIENFEVQLSTTESVSIDFDAAASATNAVKMGADPFFVKYNIN